jgi:protein phosphatase
MSGLSLTDLARRPLRVVGDVHGDLRALEHALATERFVIQLGDLVDGGSAVGRAEGMAALERMIAHTEEGRGLFLLGNHEYRLARALHGLGRREATEAAHPLVSEAGRARLLAALSAAPAWLRLGALFFVHAAFHPAMLVTPPPRPLSFRRAALDPLLATALYGGVRGEGAGDYPRRSRAWVGLVPSGLTVYVGHDSAFTGNAPRLRRNEQGGAVIFLDTGAGKGGHLSWLDLDPPFG